MGAIPNEAIQNEKIKTGFFGFPHHSSLEGSHVMMMSLKSIVV
jgi:hypothetical protein